MNLKQYLDQREISQSEFADIIGVSRQAISLYLNGTRTPKIAIALKIQKRTHGKVSIEDLMEYSESKRKK